jgi:hypothetical protein
MKMVLTRPFLQDFGHDVFCLAVFATGDFFRNSPDVASDTFASNRDVAFAILSGNLFDRLCSPDQLPFFAVAIGFSSHAGNPFCHSSADFSHVD